MNESWYQKIRHEVVHQDCYSFKNWAYNQTNKQPCIVDIGANVGSFAVMAASMLPSAQIHAFEMVKSNFDFLQTKTNEYNNIQCHNIAIIGESKSVGKIIHKTNHGGHKVLFEEHLDDEKNLDNKWLRVGVEATMSNHKDVDFLTFQEALNAYNITKIDFLKIDAEGSEYKIFENIDQHNLWNLIENISLEVHKKLSPESIDLKDMMHKHYKNVTGSEILIVRNKI